MTNSFLKERPAPPLLRVPEKPDLQAIEPSVDQSPTIDSIQARALMLSKANGNTNRDQQIAEVTPRINGMASDIDDAITAEPPGEDLFPRAEGISPIPAAQEAHGYICESASVDPQSPRGQAVGLVIGRRGIDVAIALKKRGQEQKSPSKTGTIEDSFEGLSKAMNPTDSESNTDLEEAETNTSIGYQEGMGPTETSVATGVVPVNDIEAIGKAAQLIISGNMSLDEAKEHANSDPHLAGNSGRSTILSAPLEPRQNLPKQKVARNIRRVSTAPNPEGVTKTKPLEGKVYTRKETGGRSILKSLRRLSRKSRKG